MTIISTPGHCFHFGSIPSFFLELFLHSSPVAYWAPTDLASLSFGVPSFCLFIQVTRWQSPSLDIFKRASLFSLQEKQNNPNSLARWAVFPSRGQPALTVLAETLVCHSLREASLPVFPLKGPHAYCQIWLKCPVPVQSIFPALLLLCLLNCEISKRSISFLSLEQIQRHKEGKALACTIWKKELHRKKAWNSP